MKVGAGQALAVPGANTTILVRSMGRLTTRQL
jgi:hypothetical protein